MRVWIISPEPPYVGSEAGRPVSGVGRHLAMLTAALAAAGAEATVLDRWLGTYEPSGSWRQPYGPLAAAHAARAGVVHAGAAGSGQPVKDGATGRQPSFQHAQERPPLHAREASWAAPDVIHVHDLRLVPAALAARRSLSGRPVPVVWTAHRLPPPGPPPFRATDLAAVMAPSRWMAHRLRASAWTVPIPIHVVEAGPYPVAAARDRIGPPTGIVRLLSWGRLVPEKGWEEVLEAASLLPAQVAGSVEWMVAGAGPLAGMLVRAARRPQAGVRLMVRSPVRERELAAWLRTATAVVVPSREEVAGMVALEAMLAGVPLVTSSAGGLAEAVNGDGPPRGWTFAPGDAAGLARTVAECLSRPDEAARRAERARGWVLHARGWERLARRTLAVYGEAILRSSGALEPRPT